MLYAALKTLHLLAIVLWVGGMIFMLFFLRPAVNVMEPQQRLGLMYEVLRRFFKAVLAAILVVLVSGGWMMAMFSGSLTPDGARAAMPWTWMFMATLGLLMAAIFGHIRFVLFKRLRVALADQAWTAGSTALASIRVWVRANLSIGLLIILVVVGLS